MGVSIENTAGRSPVRAIELRVLERLRGAQLDADATTTDTIRRFIDDEIEQWTFDVDRGREQVPIADEPRVRRAVEDNLLRYGPLDPLIDDPDVWEIMINAPDQVFVRRHRGVSGYHHATFHDDDHVSRTLTKILDDATEAQRKLDPAEGLQDAQLANGARLHIVHRDVGRGGHHLVNIRKFTGVGFVALDDLVAVGMLTSEASAFLRAAARARLSIVIAGRPGAGKTTLLSCCAAALDPSLRIVTAEEVFEIDVPLPNVASMQTRPPRSDRAAVDLRRLVAGFLRMAPDVAIVGEVRDREALPLLLTLSSGVTGYTTIHAASARQALARLRFIAQLADTRSELPAAALNALVSDSVDLVVFADRIAGVPQVMEILAVEDRQTQEQSMQFTATDVFRRDPESGVLAWTGDVPIRAARAFSAAGIDVAELLRAEGSVGYA
ncbi:MAG: ATPase, T2SS/T4P/T4SS family [Nitriliruptoraceae bacterium]